MSKPRTFCRAGAIPVWGLSLLVAWLALVPPPAAAQTIRREYWLDIPGSSLSDLKASPRFPNNWTGVDFPTLFEGPVNWNDNYGTRMRGYVLPPASGDYVFWISGDDQCELYLSTDEHPVSKRLIATVNSWTGSREWGKEPNQQSAPVRLEAGQRYYVEALHKEGGGGDNVAVGWRLPNGTLERPIPGQRLAPFLISNHPPTLVQPPAPVTVTDGDTAEFRVVVTGAEPLLFQWQRQGQDIPGAVFPNLILHAVTLDDDGLEFRCRITNPLGMLWTEPVALTVLPERIPPEVLTLSPPAGSTVRRLTQVEVFFDEAVQGVDAADLLVNGQPARLVTGLGAGPYLFEFASPAAGTVHLGWAADHGIADLAPFPNAFAGGAWTVTLDPGARLPDVVINEFLSSNLTGLTDEEGAQEDWIELHNRGTTPARLEGWSLSDDPRQAGQWTFPAVTIPPGGYLVVFASAKDRRRPEALLHTNFKLSRTGEYLGLFGHELPREPVDELAPTYPEQRGDHSYGRDPSNTWRYYSMPTPGTANGASSIVGMAPAPRLSASRGFYDRPFNLHLSAGPDVTIRFTTDGSEPTARSLPYTGPVPINRPTVLRVAGFKPDHLPSETQTHTYLVGLPPVTRALPVLSLVTDNRHLWGSSGIMEINPRNTIHRGRAWERPVSAEYIRPEDNGGFQIDCGLRLQGGNYVRERYNPNGSLPFSKYSFRLYFRGDYGARRLEYPLFPDIPIQSFEQIVLRAGMNDHSNPFIVDELVRRLSAQTGQVASHGTFVNLFLNGSYKGYYNPTERINEDFLRDWYGGEDDWDLLAQFGEIQAGDNRKWNEMLGFIHGADLAAPATYASAGSLLDLDNFIDYLLLNIYGATGDWPHNNWRAARPRRPDAPFRFLVWDAEWAFGNLGRSVSHNTLANELAGNSEIARLFQALRASPEFRVHFADRLHRHFYNEGALTDAAVLREYNRLRGEVAGVLPGMSTSIQTTWVPQRRNIMFTHLRNAGLFASDHAPVFSQFGGRIPAGFTLGMNSPRGLIHYTLDGTDPRQPPAGGGIEFPWIDRSAAKRVLVPGTTNGGDTLGHSWKGGAEPFDDRGWIPGAGGVGYDLEPTYVPHIQIDVHQAMYRQVGSAFIRVPFNVPLEELAQANQIVLRVQFDDGFVAWLNGFPIASANAPENPPWNALATQGNPDEAAVNFQSFDITAHLRRFRSGPNLLAIQGLNASLTSSDFLINVELAGRSAAPPGVSPTALTYTEPVPLSQSVTVKARALDGQAWSALTEATFILNQPGLPLHFTEIQYDPPGGNAFEFLELYNAGFAPVDLSGFSFDGIRFFFPSGSVLPGHGIWVFASAADPAAFATRYPAVQVAGWYSGNLSNTGERLALRNADGQVVLTVEYGTQDGWPALPAGHGHSLENVDLQGDPNAPATWRASAQPGGTPGFLPSPLPLPVVRLNELMAANRSAVRHAGRYPDWIELFNAGPGPVELEGWSLTDNGDPRQFVFPAGVRIEPDGYLVVWCDSNLSDPGLHTGFALSRNGESVFLYDPQTNRVDAVSFGRQLEDLTLARIGSGREAWRLGVPTPGAPNAPAEVAPAGSLVINEWLSRPLAGEPAWIELHNTHKTLPAALQGLFLGNGRTLHRLGHRSFLEPGGFLQLFARERGGLDEIAFMLAAEGGRLELLDPLGEPIQSVQYPAGRPGISEGRLPDGAPHLVSFPGSPSPGASNFLVEWSGPLLNEFLAINRSVPVPPSDRTADWLEIRHPGPTPASLAGMSLSVGGPEPGQWRFPDLELAPGDHLLIGCDPGRPASSQSATGLNLGRALRGNGDAIFLYDAQGRLVDSVTFGFQIPDLSVGRVAGFWRLLSEPTPGGFNAAPAVLGDFRDVRFNEWLANPARGEDFIELFNRSALPVELSQFYLTDDPSIAGRTRFQIRPLTFIAPRNWITFIADGGAGVDSVNFGLSATGEHLRLHAPNFILVDAIDFGPQARGVSQGRLPDGADRVIEFASTASPGESNYLPHPDVVINEVLAHTDAPLEDAIELHNLADRPVDLGGWFLSDQGSGLRKFQFPPDTLLPANGFLVVYEAQFNGGPGSLVPFSLDSVHGETLHLSAVDDAGEPTGQRAQVSFGPSLNGVSFGRHLTSVGIEFVPQVRTTFGVDHPASVVEFRTGTGALNAGPLVGPLVINEIMADPPDHEGFPASVAEFLELRNVTSAPLRLFDPAHPGNTWQIRDGIQYAFPPQTTLTPNEHVVLVRFNPDASPDLAEVFRQRYAVPAATRLFGPFSGRLAANGENLELVRPDSPQTAGPDAGQVPWVLVERVDYAHVAPWPGDGIGHGASLQRIDPAAFGNEPLHWSTGIPTPGGWNSVDPSDSDQDGMPDYWELTHGFDPLDPSDALEDADGDGVNNRDEYRAGTDPHRADDFPHLGPPRLVQEGLRFTFRAPAGRVCAVQSASDLGHSAWNTLLELEPAWHPREIEFVDPLPIAGQRYYRVRITVPPR